MKKIIISIATISVFIFTSCFTDTDTATVKINLGNLPVAKTAKVEKKSLIDRFVALFLKEAVAQPVVPEWTYVDKIHLGAFDEDDQLLAKKSIRVTQIEDDSINTVVEFDVPAGIRRKIVVLGEKEDPDLGGKFINYYGVSDDEIDLNVGENREVSVNMENVIEYFPSLNLEDYTTHFQQNTPATWEHITGASHYEIYTWDGSVGKYSWTKTITTNTHAGAGGYALRIYFDFAKKETINIPFENCG